MSGFEEAVSHARMHDIVSPSPAVRGTLGGSAPSQGDGRNVTSSNHFNSPIDAERASQHRKGTIANAWPNATDGVVPEGKFHGGAPIDAATSGVDEGAYMPGSHFDEAVANQRAGAGMISKGWPDACGGDLGGPMSQKNPQTK
jgi:hypothetical protein